MMFRSVRTLSSLQLQASLSPKYVPLPHEQFDPLHESWNRADDGISKILSENTTNEVAATERVFEHADKVTEIKKIGIAPVKSALTLLLNKLQERSLQKTSLSSLRVTLFDFHSTKFAERLIERNIKEVVLVETDHKNSYAAKDFAEDQRKEFHRSVTAYRASLQTLLGVGRQKTAKLPRKLLGSKLQAKPLVLTVPSNTECGDVNGIGPILISAVGTSSQQVANILALQDQLLLHHTGKDKDTIYNYGATEFWTFLDASLLAHLLCSQHNGPDFLSHSHRRQSAVFNKLFDVRLLRNNGFDRKTFHPIFPKPQKSIPYEKKLDEFGIHNGLQYAVSIRPNNSIKLGRTYLDHVDSEGKALDRSALFTYLYWMQMVGRQPLSKRVSSVLTALCPESASAAGKHADGLAKVGDLPDAMIEMMMFEAQEEIEHDNAFKKFVQSIKVKRADE